MHWFFGLSKEQQDVVVNGSDQHYQQSTGLQSKYQSKSPWMDEWRNALAMLRNITALTLMLDIFLEDASIMIQAKQRCVMCAVLAGRYS